MTGSNALCQPAVSPLQKLSFGLLLVFLFQLHSRVLDLKFSSLHLPAISLYVSLLAAFLGGGFFRAFTHRIGMLLVVLTGWMILSIPFSVSRGGAFSSVIDWFKILIVYVLIAGVITTFDQVRRAIYLTAFAILTLAFIARLFGSMDTGRLMLEKGRFNNPNDLAQMLLMGLPLWWFLARSPRVKGLKRLAAYAAVVPIFHELMKTGSRGALIAALCMVLILFVRSSIANKVRILLGTLVLLTVGAAILPKSLKQRYFTFWGDDSDETEEAADVRMQESAIGSTESRWLLLKDSITLTLQNPILGVGTNQFANAQDKYSRAVRGHKGHFQPPHNTFTQLSSENGIPALIFYLAAVFYTLRATAVPRIRAPGPPSAPEQEVALASLCLRLSLLAFLVSAMFGCFAYQTQFLTLAGLAVALERSAPREVARAAQERSPVPAPALPFPERLSPRLRRRSRALERMRVLP